MKEKRSMNWFLCAVREDTCGVKPTLHTLLTLYVLCFSDTVSFNSQCTRCYFLYDFCAPSLPVLQGNSRIKPCRTSGYDCKPSHRRVVEWIYLRDKCFYPHKESFSLALEQEQFVRVLKYSGRIMRGTCLGWFSRDNYTLKQFRKLSRQWIS